MCFGVIKRTEKTAGGIGRALGCAARSLWPDTDQFAHTAAGRRSSSSSRHQLVVDRKSMSTLLNRFPAARTAAWKVHCLQASSSSSSSSVFAAAWHTSDQHLHFLARRVDWERDVRTASFRTRGARLGMGKWGPSSRTIEARRGEGWKPEKPREWGEVPGNGQWFSSPPCCNGEAL